MSLEIHPITLLGRVVRLEPVSEAHIPDLLEAAQDDSIWQFMRYGSIRTEERMRWFVQYQLEGLARGTDLPFTVIYQETGRAIGMTRYLDIQPANRSVEVGGTWYGVPYQRTLVNTDCKYLLLCHAFETLGCIRVQLKTDVRNDRSQRAIERIGAVREGLLRDHMILPDGTVRSSLIYSILAGEWPAVKALLQEKLELRHAINS